LRGVLKSNLTNSVTGIESKEKLYVKDKSGTNDIVIVLLLKNDIGDIFVDENLASKNLSDLGHYRNLDHLGFNREIKLHAGFVIRYFMLRSFLSTNSNSNFQDVVLGNVQFFLA
jgi:hypothetical protein